MPSQPNQPPTSRTAPSSRPVLSRRLPSRGLPTFPLAALARRSSIAAAAFGVLLAAGLAGCGGGGGGDSDGTIGVNLCTSSNVELRSGSFDNGFQGHEGDGTGAGGAGSGDGGDAGGNGGDAGGNEGQFLNTRVEIRNRQMAVVASGLTDAEHGMVNIAIRGCPGEPLEIAFLGGAQARYFDEASGVYEPYPEGRRLRVRLPAFVRNVSANAYTEAAVRLMDAQAGGAVATLDPEQIQAANVRIGRLVQDLIPGIYRSGAAADRSQAVRPAWLKQADDEVLDITRIVRPINDASLHQPGSFDDTANGRLGAVLAGLGITGGLAGEVERPASRLSELFAADLADGRLDLQGIPAGATSTTPVPLIPLRAGAAGPTPAEPIPYTYETLWRAKSSNAGSVAVAAGNETLRANTEGTAIAEYTGTTRIVYRVTRAAAEPYQAANFATASVGTQTVRLLADGRLTLTRSMSAGFSASAWWDTDAEPVVLEPSPATRFGDVKVGSRGDVLALHADRTKLTYIRPFDPYRVSGEEMPTDEAANIALLQQANRNVQSLVVELPPSRARYRILGVVSGPERRAYPGGRTPPALLMLLTDGSLWGVDPTAAQPAQPFEVPVPEPMQQVAFDHFVSQTYADPGYGSGADLEPAASPGDRAHRRLFGLTTRGTVKVWLEGLAATGRELEIPGKVVLLAGESKTHVYAMTSDGNVYWINADQALADLPAVLIPPRGQIAAYNRRYRLHQVVQVDLAQQRACWLARSEAVLCDSGEVRLWDESVNPIQFSDTPGGPADDRVLMPNNITASRTVVAGGIWRINSAQEDFVLTDSISRVSVGATYLRVNGAPLDAGTAQGRRNLLRDPPLLQVRGEQLLTALREVFASPPTLANAWSLNSTLAWDSRIHQMRVQLTPSGGSRFHFMLAHDVPTAGLPEADPNLPDVGLTLDVIHGGDRSSIRPVQLTGGDTDTNPPAGLFRETDGPESFDRNANYPLNRGLRRWETAYLAPVHGGGPKPYMTLVLRDVAGDPYAFRVCFDLGFQVRLAPAGSNSSNGTGFCTLHDSSGRFRHFTAASGYTLYDAGGALVDRQLKDIDWGSLIYLPF